MSLNKIEYKKAKKSVQQYIDKVNKELITDKVCICCKRNVIKFMPEMSIPNAAEQHTGCWSGGTVTKIEFGYGSKEDGHRYFVGICDVCINTLYKERIVEHVFDIVLKSRKELL